MMDVPVPTIGAQLDCLLQSLCSAAPVTSTCHPEANLVQEMLGRIEALELRNKELLCKLAECESWKKNQNGGYINSEFDDRLQSIEKQLPALLSSDTIQSVVEQVVGRLPMFITPVVEQSVSTILEKSLPEMHPAIIDAAVKKMKLELGYASSAVTVPTPQGDYVAAVGVNSVARSDIKSGDTVIINGLERAPELNGKVGVVNGVDSKTGRYIIDVEGCQGTRRIKRCNILAMSDLGDDSDYNADA